MAIGEAFKKTKSGSTEPLHAPLAELTAQVPSTAVRERCIKAEKYDLLVKLLAMYWAQQCVRRCVCFAPASCFECLNSLLATSDCFSLGSPATNL